MRGGGSKAVWNFSENSSVLELLSFPYCIIVHCALRPRGSETNSAVLQEIFMTKTADTLRMRWLPVIIQIRQLSIERSWSDLL